MAFFKNLPEIAFLAIAVVAIVAAFCVMTIQIVMAVLTFKFGSLAAFVLVPFGVLAKTAFIAWNYPFGDAVMIRKQVAQQQVQMQATIASGLDLSKANFNYLILRQKHATTPARCPLRAFDDGQKNVRSVSTESLRHRSAAAICHGTKR